MGRAAKADLRRRMRALRQSLTRQVPDAASRAASLIPKPLTALGVIAGYAPLSGEFDPGPVMRRFAESGAHLALPAVRERNGAIEFLAWRDGDPLAPDALGVLAPLEASESLRPDLILAPLLAFDRQGGRLGQGGGYYDRAIADLRARGPLYVVGLAFADQEIGAAPREAHDARLDAVLTERFFFEVG